MPAIIAQAQVTTAQDSGQVPSIAQVDCQNLFQSMDFFKLPLRLTILFSRRLSQ